MRSSYFAALTLLALAPSSCVQPGEMRATAVNVLTPALPAPRAWRDGSLDSGSLRRLLVLPLVDESSQGSPVDVVNQALRDEMIKLRRFDVIQPNPADATSKPQVGPKKTGRVAISVLIELGRRYGVDAVLFGTIDHYRPYAPPALGVSASLVDVETGKIVWEVRDFVDAADRTAEVAMDEFFLAEAAQDQGVTGADLMRHSPAWFARFATRRVTRTLLPPPAP
jgi:hypothetical protein